MFYAQFVLSKKGPLAKIWLAAHWEKKLTKAQVFETNIDKAVESILEPKIKMALRTTGHLLLGVVRIYSRKAKYLLADCNEACVKIKMAFRPGATTVDLPQEAQEASLNAITLPEVFHDFDSALPELNDFDYEANQSDVAAITIKEDVPVIISHGLEDEAFGAEDDDDEFDDETTIEGGHIGGESSSVTIADKNNFGFPLSSPKKSLPGPGAAAGEIFDAPNDDLGDALDDDDDDNVDAFLPQAPTAAAAAAGDAFAAGMDGGDLLASPMQHNRINGNNENLAIASTVATDGLGGIEDEEPMETDTLEVMQTRSRRRGAADDLFQTTTKSSAMVGGDRTTTTTTSEVTTLIQNEREGFVLEPEFAKSEKHHQRQTKRKRRLIVDELKSITGDDMKAQLNDYADTVVTLDLAPPTRKLMGYKEMSGAEKLLSSCSFPNTSKQLLNILLSNMAASKAKKDDVAAEFYEYMDGLHLPDLNAIPEAAAAATPEPQQFPGDVQISAGEGPAVLSIISETEEVRLSAANGAGPAATVPNDESGLNNDLIMEQYGQQGGPPSVSPQRDEMQPDFTPQSPRKKSGRTSAGAKELAGDDNNLANNNNNDYNNELDDENVGDMIMDDQFNGEPLDPSAGLEDRQWGSRTHQLLTSIKNKLRNSNYVNFVDLCARKDNRKIAAQKFYTLLVLKKWRAVDVEQLEPFGDIKITEGPRLDESLEAAV